MGYLHQVVVDHICQVVGWKAIRLQDDKVFLWNCLLKGAIDCVGENGRPKGIALEAYDVRLPLGSTAVGLGGVDGATCLAVESWLACSMSRPFLRLEVFGAAEATVGVAGVEEFLDMMGVNGESFRLRPRVSRQVPGEGSSYTARTCL